MKKVLLFVFSLLLVFGVAFADQYSESATDGTLDLAWDINTAGYAAGDTLVVVDSTASAWGSYVLAYTDAGYTGIAHLKDIALTDFAVESDIYIIGPASAEAPLYAGLTIKAAHDELKYYRFIYRNSSSSDNGILKLQGYDGASWHISKTWNPGTDFTELETGWHNFKIKVSGNQFWAYIDGVVLPGCPYVDDSPFLTEGFPGVYKYNSGASTILFDNFVVTTPDLFFSEYAEGSSNNKYVEIYNGTGAEVDLSAYSVQGTNNGTSWGDDGQRDQALTGMLADGEVYVLAADQASQEILDYADMALAYESPVHYNGDDGIALLKNGTIIDAIGVENVDPGAGWAVAGVADATKDHTLVRKDAIFMGETDWDASAGTSEDNSEWIVYDKDTWDYLGVHPGMPVTTPDFVNVTIRGNMSTNLDTLNANHVVQVRGTLNNSDKAFPDSSKITWDSGTDLNMHNVDGDYWEVTFQMAPEDTLYYKFWTGFDNATGTSPGGGWEGPFEVSNGLTWDTRTFISGMTDTVLDVQYYHPDFGTKVDQMWRPFEEKPDTVAIYFRVNMAGMTESQFFDPAVNGPVGVRGGAPVGDEGWSEGAFLPMTRETNSVLDGAFWSGTAYVPVDSIIAGNTQSYKFFVSNDGGKSWEDTPNREFKLTESLIAKGDTTLHWDWFSGIKYVGKQPVESIVTWRVSTEALEAMGLFDRGLNDSIIVRGPRGWGKAEALRLDYQPLLREWVSANEKFNTIPGNEMEYKYYVDWDSSRADETSPNYIPFIDLEDDGYEEPSVRGGSNRLHVYQDAAEQYVEGDFGFERQFFNSVPANGVFEQPMSITWNVDMTNATSYDIPFTAGDSLWVQWDGELLGITQGYDNRGTENGRFLLLKDDDGDMIYSGTFDVQTRGWYQLGYVLTYKTSDGTLVQNGSGTNYGRRYYQYIHPNSIAAGDPWPVPDWPATYNLPTVDWTIDNLFVETPPPDLTQATAIGDEDSKLPHKYALEQNYPNPFNPATTIKFELAKTSKVEISVYNVMGQLVKTLANEEMSAGEHQLVWGGKNMNGNQVTSGIYFLKMKSGKFTKVRKMTLLK